MAQSVLSVYVTEEEIRICEAKKAGKNLQVKRVMTAETPKGSVDGGMIVDVEAMAGTLHAIFEANAIKRGRLAFCVASKRIASKEITLPYVKNKQRVAEMIHVNLSDYLPMGNIQDYICRHTILDTVRTAEGSYYNISLVAVRKELIASYYELAAELNMPVETVDYYGNSIYNMIREQMGEEMSLALQMDREVTHVSIMQGRTQLFRRSVPHGMNSLIQNFADGRNISFQKAADILTGKDSREETRNVEYYDMVRELVASIARVVDFYTSKTPGVLIERAKLFGEGLQLHGLRETLEHELEIPVEEGRELKGIVFTRKNRYQVTMEELSLYLPNLGTLMGSLHLREEDENKGISVVQMMYVLMVLSAAAAIAMMGVSVYQNYRLLQEKEALEVDNNRLAYTEQTYLSFLDMKQEYELLSDYYDSTINDTEALYKLVLSLEAVMPQSVGIQSFSIENGAVSLVGICQGKTALADFIMTLKEIPYVDQVKVLKTVDTNDGSVTEFDMTFCISMQEREGGQNS